MGTKVEYRTRFEQLVTMLLMVFIEWLTGVFLVRLNDRIPIKIQLLASLDLHVNADDNKYRAT